MMPETNQTDRELLAVFAQTGSQTAFAALVERHAALVHGVCLRVLRDHHAAQDVAQAVFLTLARKASGMWRVQSVGGWLHVVAWQLAVKARRSARTRQQYEATAMREREILSQLPTASDSLAPRTSCCLSCWAKTAFHASSWASAGRS